MTIRAKYDRAADIGNVGGVRRFRLPLCRDINRLPIMHWEKRACGLAPGKNPDHVGHITATNSPPVFLVCGYNDRPDISDGLASVYLKFKQLKVPAELHIYAGSGHGIGLRANDPKPAGKWIERFAEWLADGGYVKKP